jgi:hypothetical protein
LAVYDVDSKSSKPTITYKSLVKRPTLPGAYDDDVVSYRAARFFIFILFIVFDLNVLDRFSEVHPRTLFAVMNTTAKRKGKSKFERKSYIVKYDTNTWQAVSIKRLPEKGSITCFDIS